MAGDAGAAPTSPEPKSSGKRLDSWKEIARYLDRHVTTVRRWEKSEQLPVHRHLHARLGSVYAYTNELDAWFESRRPDQGARSSSDTSAGGRPAPGDLGEGAVEASASIETLAPPDATLMGSSIGQPIGSPHERPSSRSEAYFGWISRRRLVGSPGNGRLRAIYIAAGLIPPVVAFVAWFGAAIPRIDRPQQPSSASARAAGATFAPDALSQPGAAPDPGAYDDFLQGQFFFNRRQPGDLERAESSYRRALERDSGFARAYAGLAGVYGMALYEPAEVGLTRDVALQKMRDAAEQALRLDPDLAAAHVRRANYRYETGDLAGARREIQHAARLDPRDPLVLGTLAGIAFMRGDAVHAVDLQRRAVVRDPLGLVGRANLGLYLFGAGRFEEAKTELETALQLAGPSVALTDELTSHAARDLARSLVVLHRFDDAIALVRSWPAGPLRDYGLAMTYQGSGRKEEALAALRRLSTTARAGHPAWIAEVCAYRGDREQAFRWLFAASEQSRRSGESWQPWKLDVRYSPFFAPLHRDPRWGAWLAENPDLS